MHSRWQRILLTEEGRGSPAKISIKVFARHTRTKFEFICVYPTFFFAHFTFLFLNFFFHYVFFHSRPSCSISLSFFFFFVQPLSFSLCTEFIQVYMYIFHRPSSMPSLITFALPIGSIKSVLLLFRTPPLVSCVACAPTFYAIKKHTIWHTFLGGKRRLSYAQIEPWYCSGTPSKRLH